MKAGEYWKRKLTAFDAELCKMAESLTGKPCEPKNGGDHYFIEIDYGDHNDPDYIMAMWDAVEGRVGKRLKEIHDDPERHCLWVRINFYDGACPDAAFIPKIEDRGADRKKEMLKKLKCGDCSKRRLSGWWDPQSVCAISGQPVDKDEPACISIFD